MRAPVAQMAVTPSVTGGSARWQAVQQQSKANRGGEQRTCGEEPGDERTSDVPAGSRDDDLQQGLTMSARVFRSATRVSFRRPSLLATAGSQHAW